MDESFEVIPAPGADIATVGDRDLRVSEAAREAYDAAMPANTRRAYDRAWAPFAAWCDQELRTALPATPETLMEYVHALTSHPLPSGGWIAPGSVEQTIAAIRTRHAEHGYPKTPDARAALRVLRGYRRDQAEQGRRTRKAPPITARLLRQMVRATERDSIIGLRDRTLLVVGFNMMARRSELCALRIDEVSEDEDDLLVYVRSSKTDQDAKGRECRLPRAPHAEVCPMRLTREWIGELAAGGETTGRLFRSVDRNGDFGQSLSGDAVNRIVRKVATAAGLPNAEAYTAHSLRAGGATTARSYGASMTAIAEHGRWNPRSPVVYGYVRAEDDRKDNVMRPSD